MSPHRAQSQVSCGSHDGCCTPSIHRLKFRSRLALTLLVQPCLPIVASLQACIASQEACIPSHQQNEYRSGRASSKPLCETKHKLRAFLLFTTGLGDLVWTSRWRRKPLHQAIVEISQYIHFLSIAAAHPPFHRPSSSNCSPD